MDAIVAKCLQCGKPLPERRKLKDFCSYSCRGQNAVEALDGVEYQTALVGSKNTRITKALQRKKTRFQVEKVNARTWRVSSHTRKGLAWLMGIGCGLWIARRGDRRSEPLEFSQARAEALAMASDPKRGTEVADPIRELNQATAEALDRDAINRQRRKWPVDLMGGNCRGAVDPKLRQSILDTERVLTDEPLPAVTASDYPLLNYPDGYPKLPACLDRRRVILAEAA